MRARITATRRQPERSEQAGIVKLLRSLGAVVYVLGTTRRKGDHPGTCQTPGLPDLIAFLPRLPKTSWRVMVSMEVKAPKGRLSGAQEGWANLCSEAGAPHLVGGIDAVIEWLTEAGYVKSGG